MGAETCLLPTNYFQEEEMESEELMSSLPKEKGWMYSYLYKYQGFWYGAKHLQGAITCQKQFQAQDSDVLLITTPKSGTTWLKAIIFTLVNRTRYPVKKNHPLLNKNPHDLVPFLEANLYDNQIQDQSSFRLFAAHLPYHSLPKTVHDSACKIIYLCRNPKDTFVSLWHFANNVKLEETCTNSLKEAFDLFCRGVSPCGPFWDHVLDYWKEFKKNSERILFLRYEDMKEEPGVHLRRLAQFLGCPFLVVEEETGMVEEIFKLCGFDNLSKLEINKTGKLANGVENKAFFRQGEVGDWKNLLPISMVKTIDQITEQKFSGVGLVLRK